jgi:pyroglutamyl-peptidase
MRVLLAGFGPFPGAPFNPSAALAKKLARRRRPALAGLDRTVHVFATSYAAVDRDMPKLFAAKPDIVLIFGVAARRRHICIETRARNAISLLFPDASGVRPTQSVIARGGPHAVRSNTRSGRLLGAARGGSVPVTLSRDAGRYLCNYAYWRALEGAQNGRPLVQFVHVPLLRRDRESRRRRRGQYRLLSLDQAAAACERLLIALVAASKR